MRRRRAALRPVDLLATAVSQTATATAPTGARPTWGPRPTAGCAVACALLPTRPRCARPVRARSARATSASPTAMETRPTAARSPPTPPPTAAAAGLRASAVRRATGRAACALQRNRFAEGPASPRTGPRARGFATRARRISASVPWRFARAGHRSPTEPRAAAARGFARTGPARARAASVFAAASASRARGRAFERGEVCRAIMTRCAIGRSRGGSRRVIAIWSRPRLLRRIARSCEPCAATCSRGGPLPFAVHRGLRCVRAAF
jgi:hypothetical protein